MIDAGGGKRSGSNDGFNEIVRVTTEAVTNGRIVGKGSVNAMGEGRDRRSITFRSVGEAQGGWTGVRKTSVKK